MCSLNINIFYSFCSPPPPPAKQLTQSDQVVTVFYDFSAPDASYLYILAFLLWNNLRFQISFLNTDDV